MPKVDQTLAGSNIFSIIVLLCLKTVILLFSFSLGYSADLENQDQVISSGGIIALVLLVTFAVILLGSCIYQSRKKVHQSDPQHRVMHCGGCRRAFRVPSSVDDADFMCSRCVTEGRRRMSKVLEEERIVRFAKMKESANQPIKLQRVTSTFFKVASRRTKSILGNNPGLSKTPGTRETSIEEESSRTATTTECKICFDDESCIVLIPCGHSGVCEGCAKDLVTLTKECYICRSDIELLAKIKLKPSRSDKVQKGSSTTSNNNLMTDDDTRNHLSALYVAPDTLHHLTSRGNTNEDSFTQATPALEISTSRRSSTFQNLNLSPRQHTFAEEPSCFGPTTGAVVVDEQV